VGNIAATARSAFVTIQIVSDEKRRAHIAALGCHGGKRISPFRALISAVSPVESE
jgi:hypothetical protein